MSSVSTKKTWKVEKERMLSLSLEERRKEYSCGDSYIQLSDVETWKDVGKSEKIDLTDKKFEKISENLLKEFEFDSSLDLSNKVSLFVGDITKLEIDAVVNAANNSLLGGGGVDGAIHRAAGKYLLAENKTLGGCPDGEAKISGGYNLPAKYIISTVGPRGEYPIILANAYKNCLEKMIQMGLRSIAFPCISTGVYGYPNSNACDVALRTTRKFLEENHENVDRVILCLFMKVDVELYTQRMPIMFPSKS
eukprot:TRINITY_DN13950_c0_g1_i1.p1 TRINITY_DN13950_c0_g1~~TRINITY_DN13950_c0_g1_i1.p1  ORF type:complete len:272 (+),score=60.28 TRINITY_DN13950_c0_g1_i1:69-818(+)